MKSLAPYVLLLFTLAIGPAHGQVWSGPGLLATYVDRDKAVLPGIGGHVSGALGERLRWRGTIAWHVPRATSRTYATGPRQLATSVDTNLQNVDAHYWNGLRGISAGLLGKLGKLRGQRGACWHAGIALYDRISRYEQEVLYVYSNERKRSEGDSHAMHLGLTLGMGYRSRLGPGEWRAEAGVAPFLLEFRKDARNEGHGFLFPSISIGYDWKL